MLCSPCRANTHPCRPKPAPTSATAPRSKPTRCLDSSAVGAARPAHEGLMGSTLRGTCPCGYSGAAFFGATVRTHREVAWAPAHCRGCRAVVSGHLFPYTPSCSTCGGPVTFYNDAQMSRPAEEPTPRGPDYERSRRIPHTWRLPNGDTAVIPAESCLCPSCEKYTLSFSARSFWD